MASFWRPLPVSLSLTTRLPPLLISTIFQSNAYTIYLTDLTYIWSESMDRRAIFRRSLEQESSIDPTEGDQLQIFLEKIKLGIEGGRDTTATLNIGSETNRPNIMINLKVNLPGGLSPLEWVFHLTATQQPLFASQFTEPLLQAHHSCMRENARLAEVIKEKDHVIQKMLDKLEQQGVELGQVFPQAVSKGTKVNREQAEAKVKSLAVFDFRSQHGASDEVFQGTTPLVESIFGDAASHTVSITAAAKSQAPEIAWWESRKGEMVGLYGQIQSKPVPVPVNFKDDTTGDEDDFDDVSSQKSIIPDSHPSHSVPGGPKNQKDISIIGGKAPISTSDAKMKDEDEDTSDGAPVRPHFSRGAENVSQKAKTVGRIGKNKAFFPQGDSDTTDDEKPSASPAKNADRVDGTKTASSSGDARTNGEDMEPFPPKKKGGLGTVGRKNASSKPDDSDTTDGESDRPPPKKQKGRLGRIGGKKANSSASSSEGDSSPIGKRGKGTAGIASTKKEVTPSPSTAKNSPEPTKGTMGKVDAVKHQNKHPPVEVEPTAEEKADQKRLELKRALEEKSKAPAKKKKKF